MNEVVEQGAKQTSGHAEATGVAFLLGRNNPVSPGFSRRAIEIHRTGDPPPEGEGGWKIYRFDFHQRRTIPVRKIVDENRLALVAGRACTGGVSFVLGLISRERNSYVKNVGTKCLVLW